MGWQEERLGGQGCGPILSRSKSAALPNFYRLIYAPGDHVRSGLVEICGAKEKKQNRVTIKLTIVTLTTFLPLWASRPVYIQHLLCAYFTSFSSDQACVFSVCGQEWSCKALRNKQSFGAFHLLLVLALFFCCCFCSSFK